MIAADLVGEIGDNGGAEVYVDISGTGGPYLSIANVRYYDSGPSGKRAFIISPLGVDARTAVRRQMASLCGERLRRAMDFLAEIEAELPFSVIEQNKQRVMPSTVQMLHWFIWGVCMGGGWFIIQWLLAKVLR